VRSVGGDVLIGYEGACVVFVNLKMMCRLSLSEVLIGEGVHACDRMGECMGVCMCTMLKKELGIFFQIMNAF
jgi:hypothetical protein